MRLRGISPDDAPAITRLLEGDTELALRTAAIPIPYTIESARIFLRTADSNLIFAIEENDELVGMIGLTGAEEPVEIGYWIGRVYWGRSYATAAVHLLIGIAAQRNITSLCAEIFGDNPASMRVLEKNGFTRRGEVERNLPQRGGLRRLIRYQR